MKKFSRVISKSKLLSIVPFEREGDLPKSGSAVSVAGSIESADIPRFWAICDTEMKSVGYLTAEVSGSAPREVTIEYKIDDEYLAKGYAAHPLAPATALIFSESGKYTIYSPVDADNESSKIAHEVCGFYAKDDMPDDGVILYVKERPASAYTPILMCSGIAVGMIAGLAAGHTAYGMCAGMILGAVIGVILDRIEAGKRKK